MLIVGATIQLAAIPHVLIVGATIQQAAIPHVLIVGTTIQQASAAADVKPPVGLQLQIVIGQVIIC